MINKSIVKVEQNFSAWLDNLRGVSSWVVFLGHLDQIYIIPLVGMGGIHSMLTLLMASYAVMIFFILSGFVITLSLIRNVAKNGFFKPGDFFISRIARLYPPLIFGLILSLLVYYIVTRLELHGAVTYRLFGDYVEARPNVSVNGFSYLVNFFMLQGFVKDWGAVRLNGPLWSLGYEYWLYIIAMFLTIWIKGKHALAGMCIFFLLVAYLVYSGNAKFIFFASIWGTGSLLALLYHYQRSWLTRPAFIVPIVCISLCASYVCLKVQGDAYVPYGSNIAFLFQSLVMVGAAAFFSSMAIHFRWGMSKFSNRFFRPSADYSYTLYVVHFPLLLFTYSLTHRLFHLSGTPTRVAIIISVLIAIPWFCWKTALPLENTRYFKSLLLSFAPHKKQAMAIAARREHRPKFLPLQKDSLAAIVMLVVTIGAWGIIRIFNLNSLPAESIPDLVEIPAGCFLMGSSAQEKGRDSDERHHEVCLDSYKISRHEITVGRFKEFIDATGYETDAEKNTLILQGCKVQLSRRRWDYDATADWRNPGFTQQLDHPVVCVSQHDARQYVEWLSQNSGRRFRLPSEAEWEYAARAKTTTTMYWGDDFADSCTYANGLDQSTAGTILDRPEYTLSCDDNYQYTAPAGSFKANSFGVYDILGNVWEWTCSGYDPNYGGDEKQCQSISPYRMVRGGSWVGRPTGMRAAYRGWKMPTERYNDTGFRIIEKL